MPAAAARATTVASARAGAADCSRAEAAVVGVPRTSNKSFQLMGTPSSGPSGRPARQRSVDCRASSSARSAVMRVNTDWLAQATRRQCSVACMGVSVPAA